MNLPGGKVSSPVDGAMGKYNDVLQRFSVSFDCEAVVEGLNERKRDSSCDRVIEGLLVCC